MVSLDIKLLQTQPYLVHVLWQSVTKTILKDLNAFTTYKAKVNYSSAFINVSNTKCSSICSLEHEKKAEQKITVLLII